MKIALDMDSTLAAISEATMAKLGDEDRTYDDIETWNWVVEEYGGETFFDTFFDIWENEPDTIEPLEDNLSETVSELRDIGEVHLVTNQRPVEGVTEGKMQWLDAHGIEVDEFVGVEPGRSKAELDYDIYIDDKPSLPHNVEEGKVFLIDHRYNDDAPGDYIRVDSVRDAMLHIKMDELALDIEGKIQENEELLDEYRDTPGRRESETAQLIEEVQQSLEHGSRRLTHY